MAADLLYDPITELWSSANSTQGKQHVIGYLWDTNTLSFVIPTVPVTGAGGDVNVTNFPATYAVTGTFWQATQPVSGTVAVSNMVAQGLTDTQLRATPVPVSGTFYQATQPVSIAAAVALDAGTLAALETISVANFPGSQAVTGTFWQATQPVSGPVTDTQLRATPVPVSQPAATDWRADLRRGITPQFAVISASASGDNQIVAAQVGLKIKVLQYTIVADAAVAVTWRNATTPITGAMSFAANGGTSSPYVPAGAGHLMETAVNAALNLNLGAAVGVRGHLTYILEA